LDFSVVVVVLLRLVVRIMDHMLDLPIRLLIFITDLRLVLHLLWAHQPLVDYMGQEEDTPMAPGHSQFRRQCRRRQPL
jgi:hypothetical protein